MDGERALVVAALYHRFQNGKFNLLFDILPVALVFEIEANK